MKKLIWLFILGPGLVLAQTGGLLPRTGPNFDRPGWMQPGLLVTYGDGIGQMGSAYLVTRVAPKMAWGLSFILTQSDAGPTLDVQPGVLYDGRSGPFFVQPQAVRNFLRQPPPGVQVMGTPGQIGIVVQDQDGVTKHAVRYDPQSGLITELNSTYTAPANVGPRRGAAVHQVLIGKRRVPWPNLNSFPPAARVAARYQIFYVLQGGTSPGGMFTVTPLASSPPLASYQITTTGTQGYTPPTQMAGLPCLGPHYLHPALLNQNPLLEIADLGLSFQVSGTGPNGGVMVVVSANGAPFESLEVDPQSGAVIEERLSYAGMGMVVYRRLP